MKSRILLYSDDARKRLMKGINAVADMVKVTLGPKGKHVILDRDFRGPLVTKDGVTVAKEIFLRDGTENMGAQLIKQVASQTADVAGDGTTTATVLAQALMKVGLKSVAAGSNPMDIKRGMDKARDEAVKYLNEHKKDVTDKNDIISVGTISANNDIEIGELIASAMEEVGNDGVITIDDSPNASTFMETVDGMQFDRGYLSPYFATKMDTLECILDVPYVFTYSGNINSLSDIAPVLEHAAKSGRPLLILADDVSTDVLKGLIMNKVQGRISVCAVKAPGFGDRRRDMLEDIAILTGGKIFDPVISEGGEQNLLPTAVLGSAKRVTVTRDKTVVVDGAGKEEEVSQRIDQIKMLIEEVTSDYDKQKLQERLAKLTGGVALLKVGAPTEAEMQEKKARIEDALHATRAAVEEGIVPGGGIALLRCSEWLAEVQGDIVFSNNDQITGYQAVMKAIQEPFRAIIRNGGENSEMWEVKVKAEGADKDLGYDALSGKLVNMYAVGVIDPTKVVRSALEHAVSIAGLVLTTEGIVVTSEEEKKELEDMMKAQA